MATTTPQSPQSPVVKKISVILTDRAPVKIDPEQWGTIASAKWYAGEHASQASETEYIRVRQHDDGRTLVYGERKRGPGGMPSGYTGRTAGYLLDRVAPEEQHRLVEAIRKVGGEIFAEESTIAACIADLPPEEI